MSKEFGFVIIGTLDNMQSESEAKNFLKKLMKGEKFSDINLIHIFDWKTK
jgi:hypothetical protein